MFDGLIFLQAMVKSLYIIILSLCYFMEVDAKSPVVHCQANLRTATTRQVLLDIYWRHDWLIFLFRKSLIFYFASDLCIKDLVVNSTKVVIPLPFISWRKTANHAVTPQCQSQFTPKDESKRGSTFAFIFGLNWPVGESGENWDWGELGRLT